MASQPIPFVTPEQYLELERNAEFRHEYIEGVIVAMSGASWNHSRIVASAAFQLRLQLGKEPCQIATTDVRLQATSRGLITYPDVMVICGPVKLLDDRRDTVTDATVIIEVLSASTRNWDLGDKFTYYRSLPSLVEYLAVEQASVKVSHYVRQPNGSWLLRDVSGADAVIELRSIGCALKLGDLYEQVVFDESES